MLLNITATIRIQDLLKHYEDGEQDFPAQYMCYHISHMIASTLEALPQFPGFLAQCEFNQKNKYRHYSFLEYVGKDFFLSNVVVGYFNSVMGGIVPNRMLKESYFNDDLLEFFQVRSLESIARLLEQEGEYTTSSYTIWGRECRIAMMKYVLAANPDAEITFEL